MERTLLAWIDCQQIGTLSDRDGIWSFRYAPVWLEAPGRFALCPDLPLRAGEQQDGSTLRPVQWYFDNLLPEEGQRVLLASAARVDGADAFGLLGHYGAESAGSLTLLPPGAEQTEGGLRPLSDVDLSARIAAMPSVPLVEGALKRMSLAGAQHKLAVVLQDGELFEPSGRTPSTHILKPDHPHPYKYLEGSVGRLDQLAAVCRSTAVARTALFQWLVFNVLVGNTDAHLKNLSFLVSSTGIQLAPFYDLICTAVYDTPAFGQTRWPAATAMAWPLEGRARIAEIDRRCLMEAGEAMRIKPATVARLLDRLKDKIAGEAQALYAQVERGNAELLAQRPELAATFAGELRCLRTIFHVVIAEQVARLK